MERREFVANTGKAIGLGFLFLAFPSLVLARNRRVADFLQNYNPVYHPNQNWGHGQGRFLTELSTYGPGGYEFYVDGIYIAQSVDDVPFDPRRQILRVERNGHTVWEHEPPRVAPQSLRQRRRR